MMNRHIFLLVGLAFSASMSASSMRDLWVSMPDSLLPTFNKNQRLEFVELKEMGVKAEVKNLLGEDCLLDTLSAEYLQMATSKVSTLQIKLLAHASGDSVICVVRTYSASVKESTIKFYDQHWKELGADHYLPSDVFQVSKYLKSRPDTMSNDKYSQLFASLEPEMFYSEFLPADNSLVFQVSQPFLSKEEKIQMAVFLLQRKFKWNGEIFKEI